MNVADPALAGVGPDLVDRLANRLARLPDHHPAYRRQEGATASLVLMVQPIDHRRHGRVVVALGSRLKLSCDRCEQACRGRCSQTFDVVCFHQDVAPTNEG